MKARRLDLSRGRMSRRRGNGRCGGIGGLWIEGVDFLAPNFAENAGDPVSLQLFVKPMVKPASAFHEARLRGVIHGLHERVYRIDEGDALYEGTLAPGCHPKLVPAQLAASVVGV